jgi:serine/threonine protein phosphatase PrpC
VGSGTSLDYCDLSDIGRRRASNQDSRAVVEPYSSEQYRRRGWLFLVADGMGAHAAGETASALAAEQVPLAYEKHSHRGPPLALRTSMLHANAEIHARGETAADLKGMGTTCTALVIVPRGALVGHIGDSRAYRVRGGMIEQLSRDHSLAWDMEAARAKPGGEAIQAPPKNIITRSMGPHGRIDVDLEGPFPVEQGDVFILCSDGLSGQVADEEIGCFAATLPPGEAAAAMLGLSLVRGAPDNVTLIVATAGPKEVTDPTAANTPWPLADDEPQAREPGKLPWRTLSVAGGALLAALIVHPFALTHPETGLLGRLLGHGLAEAVGWSATVGMLLLFIAALVAAIVGAMPPAGRDAPLLKPGDRLGGGPYRSYGCSPSSALVEGITASVETAADGLSDRERQRALEHVAAARKAIAGGALPKAVAAAAKAIAVYRQAVEAARRDDTIRIWDK